MGLLILLNLAWACRAQAPLIGAAGAVSGKVLAFAPKGQAVGRVLGSGHQLFLNERITTDAKGRLQVMLLDETTFTLGPDSSMVLDEFVYDPGSGSGKVAATVTRGVFRFVTGKVAAARPSDMKVRTPAGTIGVRGTMVIGKVEGEGVLAALLGPGPNRNSDDAGGGFTFENEDGSSEVTQPGYCIRAREGSAPGAPQLLGPQDMGRLTGALMPPPAQDKPGGDRGGPASRSSGQQDASARGDLRRTQLALARNERAAGNAANALFDQANRVIDGKTTWEKIRSIETGSGQYTGSAQYRCIGGSGGNCPSVDQFGTMQLTLDIDFQAKRFGGGLSKLIFTTGPLASPNTPDQVSINQVNFPQSGESVINLTQSGGQISNLVFDNSKLIFENKDGVIAKEVAFDLRYDGLSGDGDGVVRGTR